MHGSGLFAYINITEFRRILKNNISDAATGESYLEQSEQVIIISRCSEAFYTIMESVNRQNYFK